MSKGEYMLEELYKILSNTPINKEALLKLIPILRELEDFEFYHPAHCYNILDHSIKAAELVDDLFLKLMLIFHDIGKPSTALVVANTKIGKPVTKFPNHEKESVRIAKDVFENQLDEDSLKIFLLLIKYHDTPLVSHGDANQMEILIDSYGSEFVGMLLKVQRADMITHDSKYYHLIKPRLDESFAVYELKYKR